MLISNWSSDVCSSDLMFSQIAQAMKHPPAVDPMAGLRVQKIIAVGQSQSGTRLRDYLIKVQPEAQERKSVVEGKSVSGRVDIGRRGIIQTQKHTTYQLQLRLQ